MFFLEQIRKDILKGRTLDNLPEVRKALGEVAGYLEQIGKSFEQYTITSISNSKETSQSSW